MATGQGAATRIATALDNIVAYGLPSGGFGMLHENPADVGTNSQDPTYTKGGLYIYGTGIYRYVQFMDAVTYAVGQIVFPAASDGSAVTNDYNGGSGVQTNSLRPCGVVMKAVTQNQFGFVLVYGNGYVLCNNDDNGAAGDPLITTAADGGLADSAADPNPSLMIGWATAAVTAGTNLIQAEVRLL